MSKLDELKAKREEIYRIAKEHKVEKLYVFGSCARKEDTSDSDIDFVAKYSRGTTCFIHFDFKEKLADLLHHRVDVVSMGALTDDTFSQTVRKEMVLL